MASTIFLVAAAGFFEMFEVVDGTLGIVEVEPVFTLGETLEPLFDRSRVRVHKGTVPTPVLKTGQQVPPATS